MGDMCDDVRPLARRNVCDELKKKVYMHFFNTLAWTNVPKIADKAIWGARMSAFKIFFLNARKFGLEITKHGLVDVLAFAVGDAAMDVHFFSGTGVNIGFKAARFLCDLLGRWNGSPAYANKFADGSGRYAATVHRDARHFANAQHVNPDLKIRRAKEAFLKYDRGLRASVRTTWLDDHSLVQEYHQVMSVYSLHKHMDTSYNVLHAATYRKSTRECDASRKPCLMCPALSCAAGDENCLWPVKGSAIALTENQKRILDYTLVKSTEDLGTNCVLRETYGRLPSNGRETYGRLPSNGLASSFRRLRW